MPDDGHGGDMAGHDVEVPKGQHVADQASEGDLDDEIEARIEQIVMERYSGPFPHPEHLERYAALYPRAPEVIFNTFEEQSAHRRQMETKFVEGNERRADRGQLLAYSLVLLTIGVGLVSVLVGSAVTGGVIIGAAFTGGVVLYIAGGRSKVAPAARVVGNNSRDRASATAGRVRKPTEPPSE